jgi:hypothetical protein
MGYQKKIEALEEKSQCGINALTVYSCRTQFCLASFCVLQSNIYSYGFAVFAQESGRVSPRCLGGNGTDSYAAGIRTALVRATRNERLENQHLSLPEKKSYL